jgi:hypothetical protein
VQIADHADCIEILRTEDIVVADLLAPARHQSDQAVAEQDVVNQLLGGFAGHLQGKPMPG